MKKRLLFLLVIVLMVTIEILYINFQLNQQLGTIEEKQVQYKLTLDDLEQSSNRILTNIKVSKNNIKLDQILHDIKKANTKNNLEQYNAILAAN